MGRQPFQKVFEERLEAGHAFAMSLAVCLTEKTVGDAHEESSSCEQQRPGNSKLHGEQRSSSLTHIAPSAPKLSRCSLSLNR